MKHLLRPYLKSHLAHCNLALGILAAAAAMLAAVPCLVHAQATEFAPFFDDSSPLLAHSSPAGYLGVDTTDVDADKVQTLKLKEVRGAVITLIDHDAPAGQIGLRVNDVILAIDGQNVEGTEALRRILREIPPGRKVSLEISRDGNIQTLAVQLVDRKALDHEIWGKIGAEGAGIDTTPPPPGLGILPGGGAPVSGGFHMSLFTSTLNVGAMVEPLTSQMDEYLGVQGGLMVKQVAKKSEAAKAGLKAFDVILKVGSDSITTSADWDRALRSNVGKPVQVTILRDKKQQTLTLQVDSKHRSAVEFEDLFDPGAEMIVAQASPISDSDLAQALAAEAQAASEAARAQADAIANQMGDMRLQLGPDQAEQLRKQAERLGESLQNFKVSPEQMDQLRRQSEKLRQQMDQFRKSFSQDQMKQLQQQIEKFRQQMQQWQSQSSCHFV